MSCLDVMYHQSYGARYLPSSSAAAAAAYKAAYYHHHHQQQQRKLSVYSKMQECVEPQGQHCPEGRQQHGRLPREQGLRRGPEAPGTGSDGGSTSASTPKDSSQPAEAEYLSSRCVLFSYFHGNIEDVVDEHFSRALSQSSAFSGETKHIRTTQPPASSTAGLWKDGVSHSAGQSASLPSSSLWNSAYPSQATCLPSVSVSVHPDFSPSPVPFHPPDGALWAGHALSQSSLPHPPPLSDAWTYSLNPQSTAGYPHIHEVYPHPHPHPHPHTHPHMHMHARHPHTMLRSHPAQSPALDPRFGSLLLPGVRGQSQPVPSPGSHSEGIKTEMDPSSTSPIPAGSTAWPPSALHGPLDTYDSALDQDKVKTSAWF